MPTVTMAKFNASEVQLYVFDGSPTPTEKLIAEQTKCSLKLGTREIDVTSKQNDGWEEVLGGLQNGELTVEMFEDTEAGASEVNTNKVYEIWRGRTRPKWVLKSSRVGFLNKEFFGLITALDLNYDMESGAVATMTLKLTAAPVTTVVSA